MSMKMWKVAVAVTLCVASTSFGALTLKLVGPDGTQTAAAAPGSTLELTLMATVDGGTQPVGITAFLKSAPSEYADPPTNSKGYLGITGRVGPLSSQLDSFARTEDEWKTNGLKRALDMGVNSGANPRALPEGASQLWKVALLIPADAVYTQDAPLNILNQRFSASKLGGGSVLSTDIKVLKADGTLGAGGTAGSVMFTITPEPASMLLVAAGAAFFARRRKA